MARPGEARPAHLWLALGVGLTALWFLSRPYIGIIHDAQVYIGRALADLDPGGIGSETDFVRDGQSAFSAFRPAAVALVAAMGPGMAAIALTGAALAAFWAAAGGLIWRMSRERTPAGGALILAGLVCVAAFPSDYGGLGVFHWAEPFITPRIGAEAASLTALMLLLDGRRWWALALLAGAAGLHPIMAAGPLAVALALMAWEDRRGWWLIGAGAVGFMAAAAAGAPVAGRLFEAIDPAWRAAMFARTPNVLIWTWPVGSWALIAVQMASVGLAAWAFDGRVRRLMLAAAGVAAAGTAVALIAPASLLIVQLQPWRALWLVSCLAAAGFAPMAVALWRRGGAARGALALIAAAWLTRDAVFAAVPLSAAALALIAWPAARPFPRVALLALWAGMAGLAIGALGLRAVAFAAAHAPFGEGHWPTLFAVARSGLVGPVAAALAVVWAARGGGLPRGWIAGAAAWAVALGLAALAVMQWDDRPDFTTAKEAPGASAALKGALQAGDVYWFDGQGAAWLWTGLPEWRSGATGAGVVFDRALALEWTARRDAAVAAGLEPAGGRVRRDDPGRPRIRITTAKLARLCAGADAPNWVIAEKDLVDPPALPLVQLAWRAPAPDWRLSPDHKAWVPVWDFVVFACKGKEGP
ncbi:MAG TPA: hypothetical protein VFE03_10165 [Caulobacteraceae bacterium]|nr:hypothetical protein [Caulobacteraceae bacterium]